MKWPAKRITESSTKSFGMYEKAIPMMEQGIDVIHLEVGMPSFDTPPHIKEAAKQALDDGQVHYSDFRGLQKFREALAEKVFERNYIEAQADEILVCSGVTHAAFAICMAAIDTGDEVIVLEPYYPQHVNKIELPGGKVVPVPLDKANGFRIDAEAIERAVTPRTRMIALVNPANPTGRVFTYEELESLADVARRHDLLIMSDEVYEQITYDGNRHISIASLPGMKERTLTMYAFTKAYAMDGWRMGYIVADKKFMPAILKITMNDIAHLNTFIQEGGYAAVKGSQDCVREMVIEDRRRGDLVVRRMNAMPGVSCRMPEGTIYAFPDVSATGVPSEQIANELLEQAHVVVEEGTFYGDTGEGHLRICFGTEPIERIEEAMNRLEEYFTKLMQERGQI
ncbi:MAG: pyridoxal phosphate-dependent aminotransferase [Gammaproteobacteria bacterium]|nr:pyridoxal phosphate-dependent aminotransferase [Gammaproteobacteria bacterium]